MSDTPEDKNAKATQTLDDGQIESRRGVSRRSMLRGFGIGTLGLGAAGVAGCVPTTTTTAYIGSGYTDADNGPIVDPAGFGRGPRRAYRTGITDADNGPIVDAVGFGRG
ncbi:hypothetical protein [Roseicyclus persicicus]|uniref:Uncharacterized protein n=1 Tax=Roseicyclus persicicus TaxID=2650661 RepID=A0A7X6JXC9_9RHOB|nr:hypothetical protein [Roseibacterium persicicum]NKX44670.1 hypothetical protein [Roseibacterium persicicum]